MLIELSNLLFRKVTTVLLVLIMVSPSMAQIEKSEALELIKEQGLVVRLNCNSSKREALNELIHKGTLSESRKKRVQEELSLTDSITRKDIEFIMQTFEDHYKFSTVYFVPDTIFKASDNALNISEHLISLDQDLAAMNPGLEHFIFAYYDYGDYKTIRLRQSEFSKTNNSYLQVQSPFPNKIKSVSFIRNLFRIFVKDSYQKDIIESVKKLNDTFHDLD